MNQVYELAFFTLQETINTKSLVLSMVKPTNPSSTTTPDAHADGQSTTCTSTRTRRNVSAQSLVHRNLKPTRSSPYAIPGNGGQEIHTPLPCGPIQVLSTYTPTTQHCDSKICSGADSISEGKPIPSTTKPEHYNSPNKHPTHE